MPWLAHLYTATGAILGFLALVAAAGQNFRAAFLWMFAAILVDASDGWVARRLRVSERLPSFDGAKLDDIVDYVTYVFVPSYLIYRAGLFPSWWALPLVCAVLLSSAYGFVREDAKTSDHFFTGFPSYWNIAALYLYLAQMPSWLNAVVLMVLCALVFVRTTYLYPSRMPVWRTFTLSAASVWGTVLLWMIWKLPERSPSLLMVSAAFPVYYALLSIVLDRRRKVSTRWL